MEHKSKRYLVIIGLLTLVIIILVFLNVGKQISSAPQEILEECNTLNFNDENGINLVFFSPEESAKEYSEYLINAEPFNEYSDSFNFFYIDSHKPKCELYKGIAIYCHSRDLIKKAASCPYDYVVVLDEMDREIRSSAYQNVMSINSNHPKSVFLHEFGHAFANFAEEYTPARIPRGSENCQKGCDKFGEESDGCFKECSNSGHYRSIEKGVMRTLSTEDYGIYNDNLIRSLIENSVPKDLQITGSVVDGSFRNCENERYFMADIIHDEEKFESTLISKHTGCSPNPSHRLAGDFKLSDGTHFTSNLVYTMSPEDGNHGVYKKTSSLIVIPETSELLTSIIDLKSNEVIGQISLPSTGGNILCRG